MKQENTNNPPRTIKPTKPITYRAEPYDSKGWPLAKRAWYRAYRTLIQRPARQRVMRGWTDLPPCPPLGETHPAYSVHSLLGSSSLEMGICAYKSLVLAAGKPLPFVFHDDGSLHDDHARRLLAQFPGGRVVRRSEADATWARQLAAYPHCRAWRDRHVLALKLLDFPVFSGTPRITNVDSDILFFEPPAFLMEQLEGGPGTNFFNKDPKDSYVLPAGVIADRFGIAVKECIDAGLSVVNRADIALPVVEAWLADETVAEVAGAYLLEQTFMAMLASRSPAGAAHLPAGYDVSLTKPVETSVCKHYVGRIRHGFELEGLRYLEGHLDFKHRWHQFVRHA